MNCNTPPKCSEPCGDCTQEWPVPAGGEVDQGRAAFEQAKVRGDAFPRRDIDMRTATEEEIFAAIDEIAWRSWQARAALQSQQPAGWRPIETAPKDGRMMLLFYTNSNGLPRVVVAGWLTDDEAAETDADGFGLEAGWYERIDNWGEYYQVAIHEGEPTHWMPLPPAPGSAAPALVLKRLSEEQIEGLKVWEPFIGLWPQTRKEIARAIESALAEANGVKLEDAK